MTILYFELQLSYCRGLPYSKFDPETKIQHGCMVRNKEVQAPPCLLSHTLQFNEIPGDIKFENIKVIVP